MPLPSVQALASERPTLTRTDTERSAAQTKSIQARIKRNYIYFSSLLQEPEAKWRPTVAARGVEVSQLDSIDPTLVVYRAEATFVGVGLWDLVATIAAPGTRAQWDRALEEQVLLADVSPLSRLWLLKTRAAWPAQGRDAALLSTVYKGPGAAHVFAFSADEPQGLFGPTIPPAPQGTIRAQVDLYGFAIEALSPTTTLVTLLEQSDPKGWAGKAGTPQTMIAAVAGIGEFVIRSGGPPVCTRLAGARVRGERYEHERGVYRLEYEGRARDDADAGAESSSDGIECELRADLDTWASSLDIVVDPPPQTVTALRRHRLASAGGGLWLTLTHDEGLLSSGERVLVLVRRGPTAAGGKDRDKGAVLVNGARIGVDIEEMAEDEVKAAQKARRSKPTRLPLDRPPVLGVIRKRWGGDDPGNSPMESPKSPWGGGWTGWMGTAVQQVQSTTREAVAAISPPMNDGDVEHGKPPMQPALDALAFMHAFHAGPRRIEGWTLVADKGGFPVHRKICSAVSASLPVHRGEKVLEGVAADEVAAVLTSYGCRAGWDDRFAGATVLQAFGADAHTAFVVGRGGFPFRDRGFVVARVVARTGGARPAVFVVSASCAPPSGVRHNAQALPVGRVLLDGWALETLDPYGAESFAIPSTRVTRLVAVDYGGSIPAAVNALVNGALPRQIAAVEAYMKNVRALPVTRMPPPGVLVSLDSENRVDGERRWALKGRDASRSLITTSYTPDTKAYRTVILLGPGSSHTALPKADDDADVTPRPSRLSLGGRRPSDASATTLASRRRKDSLPMSLPGSPYADASGAVTAPTSPPRSPPVSPVRVPWHTQTVRPRSTSRSMSGAGSLAGAFVPRAPGDWLVAELVLDARLYPAGCAVTVRSAPRVAGAPTPLALPDAGTAEVPVVASVHALPASALHAGARYALRLAVPTAQFQRAPLRDPLTGEARVPPARPAWLAGLHERGAVLDVRVTPLPKDAGADKDSGRKSKLRVLVDGAEAREGEVLTGGARLAVLSLAEDEGAPVLPTELVVPLAVAQELVEPAVAADVPAKEDTPAEEKATSPVDEAVSVSSVSLHFPVEIPSDMNCRPRLETHHQCRTLHRPSRSAGSGRPTRR
jgi:hypothetical protein